MIQHQLANSQAHVLLKNIPLLRGFTVKTLRKFLEYAEVVDVPYNSYLCR